MQEKTKKLVTLVMLALALVGGVLAALFAGNQNNVGMFWGAYTLTGVMAVVSLALILWFAIYKMAKNFKENPKAARKTLIVFGIAIVLCVVSFLLASGNDLSQTTMDKYNLTSGISKFVGTGIILTYILVIVTIAAIIFVECAKFFKKK